MNLRVDLILETEQRSASVVNVKGLLQIVYIVVPLILVVIIAVFVSNMISISSNLKALEAELAEKNPKKDAAIKYREDLVKNKQALEELEGWRKSRINWAEQLVNIQKTIPSEIQLVSMKINQSVEPVENVASRNFSIIMKGKALGNQARFNVETLGKIEKNPAFTNVMKEAKVADYKKNEEPTAKEGEMLFQVEASYLPRKFK
jgi:Tfp pilus assembly protein PilN